MFTNRLLRHLAVGACAVGLLGSVARAQIQSQGPVALDSGKINGAITGEKNDISVYKGIPFAAPPVGDLRWRPPQPVESWEGVRDALKFGSIAPQQSPFPTGETQSEDCLYLNVWTPAKTASDHLPVMVWIHGGGFTFGAGSTIIYYGTRIAEQGVVVVTLNYRLNILGGFAHPRLSQESQHGVSGNYGLLDQIEALRWVSRNIGRFGGDPDNVTIFGESAGGLSVTALMISPMTKGLFQRAIVESGSRGAMGTLEGAEKAGIELVEKMHLEDDSTLLTTLRSKPWKELPDAARFRGGPVVDGWVFTDQPENLWAKGEQHDVPMIVGYNRDEATFFLRGRAALPATVDEYKKAVAERFPHGAQRILELYPAKTDDDVYWAEIALRTDSSLGVTAPQQLRGMFIVPAKGWLYYFTRVPPGPTAKRMGASHAAELRYVFGTIPASSAEVDRRLSEAMIRYWTQFAKSGNPNQPGLPDWPAFEKGSEGYLELGDTIRAGKDLKRAKIEAIQAARGNERG
jgi:para-nitrobenzyl esterase